MNSYRIFHLIKGLGRGGAEVLLQQGFSHRDSNKFTYGYGYFLPWKNAVVPALQDQGAEVVCFQRSNFGGMLLSIPEVSDFLKKWGADLVHCHLPLAGVIGRIAGKKSNVRVVYTEHNLMERYHPATRWANLSTWKMQDAVVAVSKPVEESIRSRVGGSVPVTVVENGIPVEIFQPSQQDREQIRHQYDIPDHAIVIGTVAVFRRQKDLKTWLNAAKIISNKRPDVYFLLVGAGPMLDEIQAYAKALQLNTSRFAGLQSNVNPYYCAMDVYMSSSIFEGLPLSLLEAMAMELPILATAVGGVPDVVGHGISGFLVVPRSPGALAEKMFDLLEDQKIRIQFGRSGRRIVETKFSMQRMVRHLESLYLQILENSGIAV